MASNVEHGTILRIKRKCTDDPYEALLIHHGKKKKGDVIDESKDECLFKFAGTIHTEDATKNIINDIKRKWTGTDTTPYKPKSRKETVENRSRLKRVENAMTPTKSEDEKFDIFDIVSDLRAVSKEKENEEDIVCNSVKLIRERLKIEQESDDSSGYVYDLYFAPEQVNSAEAELFDVEFFEDVLKENENESDSNLYDDEDDSNDESNWRNDYPDESSGDDQDISSDEDECADYGYRNKRSFDPYYTDDKETYFDTVANSDDDG